MDNSNNNDSDLFDEIDLEDSSLEIPIDKRKVFFERLQKQVKHIFNDYINGDLDVRPSFQRKYVWDKNKASRLIESILLQVPITVIYSALNENDKEIIIDGQQRLYSVLKFIKGEDPTNEKDDFKLSGLKVMKELNGVSFKKLNKSHQNAINNYSFTFFVLDKNSHPDLKFEIFERLNTGAVKLNDQELRNCIYRGSYNDLLSEMSENNDFQNLLNSDKLRDRMLDNELILRFLSFYHKTYLNYKSPMKKFLSDEMEKYNNISEQDINKLKIIFKKSVDLTKTVFGDKSFRRFKLGTDVNANGEWEIHKINKGLFDIVMWGFTQYDKSQIVSASDTIREELIWLMTEDKKFIDSISVSTGKRENVIYRFDKWRTSLNDIVGQPRTEPRTFSTGLKKQLWETNPSCAICNQQIIVLDDAELDHIKFYWKGGKTISSNARLVHRYCNRQRGGRE